jgi:hypothetical protein
MRGPGRTSGKWAVSLSVVALVATGCVEAAFDIPEEAQEWATNELVDRLLRVGMTFHDGTSPPELSGVYLLDEAVILYHDRSELEGRRILESQWEFRSTDDGLVVTAEEEEGPLSFYEVPAAIRGDGDCFTLLFLDDGESVPPGEEVEEEEDDENGEDENGDDGEGQEPDLSDEPCPQDQWFIFSACMEDEGLSEVRIADEVRRWASPDGRCVTETEGRRVVSQDFVERIDEDEGSED